MPSILAAPPYRARQGAVRSADRVPADSVTWCPARMCSFCGRRTPGRSRSPGSSRACRWPWAALRCCCSWSTSPTPTSSPERSKRPTSWSGRSSRRRSPCSSTATVNGGAIGPQITIHVLAIITLLVLGGRRRSAVDVLRRCSGRRCRPTGRGRSSSGPGGPSSSAESPLVRTAYSWESVVDEFVFVIGPPLAAGVAASVGAPSALALTAVIGASGTAALLAQSATEPPARARQSHLGGRLAIGYPGMPAVVIVMVDARPGLRRRRGHGHRRRAREGGSVAAAGVVLALWSVSSMTSGLVPSAVCGAFLRCRPQLLVGAAATTAAAGPAALGRRRAARNQPWSCSSRAPGVSPALIAGFALAARLVPPPP